MSWHTSALLLLGDHSRRGTELFAELGFPGLRARSTVTGDVAGRSDLPGKALGVVGGWTLIWDPMMFIPEITAPVFSNSIWSDQLEAALVRYSREGRVYSFLSEGASSTYGFAWYVAGRRERLRLSQEGSIILADGAPLAAEVAALSEDADEENLLFTLLTQLTDIRLDDVFATDFTVFA